MAGQGQGEPEQIQGRWENQIIGRIPDREVGGWQRVADAAADQCAGIAAAQAIDVAIGERAEGPSSSGCRHLRAVWAVICRRVGLE